MIEINREWLAFMCLPRVRILFCFIGRISWNMPTFRVQFMMLNMSSGCLCVGEMWGKLFRQSPTVGIYGWSNLQWKGLHSWCWNKWEEWFCWETVRRKWFSIKFGTYDRTALVAIWDLIWCQNKWRVLFEHVSSTINNSLV